MRVAVIGARGQLGAAMVAECGVRYDMIAFDRAALDVTDDRAVKTVLTRARPDVIINCTGYNQVDAAQEHPVDALSANAFAVRSMARVANVLGAALVHFSSDFVFDGAVPLPRTEGDPPNPRSTYAASKLLGEWFASDVARRYVLRVESLFGGAPHGPPPKGTVAGIVKNLREGRVQKVFRDRTVSPTFVPDAVRATCELLDRRAEPGLYHCVNSGYCTWLEFATEAARLLKAEPTFEIVRFADVQLPAARPQYCALSNEKLVSAGIPMPTWNEALRRFLNGSSARP